MSVGITITGDKVVLDYLNLIRDIPTDYEYELLYALGAEIESQTRRRIQTEKTSPDGGRWQPWSSSYAATRGAGQSLLMDSGQLLMSIYQRVESHAVVVGTNKSYASDHQFGKDHLPARPFLGLSDDDKEAVQNVANDYLSYLLNSR